MEKWKKPTIEHQKITKFGYLVEYPEELILGINIDIGNVLEKNLAEIWNGKNMVEIRNGFRTNKNVAINSVVRILDFSETGH